MKALPRVPNVRKRWIRKLTEEGVQLLACANRVRLQGLDKVDRLEPTVVVPAGVSELMEKPAEGRVHIRSQRLM